MTAVFEYSRIEVEDVDIAEVMREGHPYIREGDEYIIGLVERYCKRLGRPAHVLEVGCGTGVFSEMLAERVPEAIVVAHETEPKVIALAKRRLARSRAQLFTRPFEEWEQPQDLLISWGSHHHLPKTYLDHAKRLLGSEGILILGDEFCPEYCKAEDAARIANAEIIQITDGFVLTNFAEVQAYQSQGRLPQTVLELERRRQSTLWNWYKYVIDYAIEHGYMNVALAELQIARNDLTTGFGGEHKLSSLLVERELELHGFRQVSKHILEPDAAELQSFLIYEFVSQNMNIGGV